MRFGFGKNWAKFVKHTFDEEKAARSRSDLLSFLQLSDLSGKSFLDIGSGSGLSSLAAIRSGASRVVSFDYDIFSVKATKQLREYEKNPDNWEVLQGSILDDDFVSSLGLFDIVYSWGVLHHTGDVWHALDNTNKLLVPSGYLYIALYEYNVVTPSAEFWLDIKQKYIRGNILTKRYYELWYIWRFMMQKRLKNLPQVLRQIRAKKERGMAFYYDLVDWLGGWPMEFVKLEQVKEWAEKNNLDLINLNYGKVANTEYLFRRVNNGF